MGGRVGVGLMVAIVFSVYIGWVYWQKQAVEGALHDTQLEVADLKLESQGYRVAIEQQSQYMITLQAQAERNEQAANLSAVRIYTQGKAEQAKAGDGPTGPEALNTWLNDSLF